MTRRRMHLLFGCVATGFALLAAWEGIRLAQTGRINDTITNADATQFDASVPEALFAHAHALTATGDSAKAIEAYKQLVQGERSDLRTGALYNLGNVYMRDALEGGTEAAMRSLPLIELAKQSYRELLRDNPEHWDARYNLEHALRLAPEYAGAATEVVGPEIWNRRVIRAMGGFSIELP